MHIAYYLPWSFNWALVVLLYRREIYSKSHSTNLQSLCYCSQKNSEHHWKCQSKELWKASLHKSNENTSQKKKSKSTFFLKMLELTKDLQQSWKWLFERKSLISVRTMSFVTFEFVPCPSAWTSQAAQR